MHAKQTNQKIWQSKNKNEIKHKISLKRNNKNFTLIKKFAGNIFCDNMIGLVRQLYV